ILSRWPVLSETAAILSLKETPFGLRNNEDKLATIQLGPPRPNITIKQVATKKGKSYTRGFSKNWYCDDPANPDGNIGFVLVSAQVRVIGWRISRLRFQHGGLSLLVAAFVRPLCFCLLLLY